MSEPQDAGHMLEVAEQAAMAGDLESADALLRGALRIQEAALGPLHPELANTLNNLAIVAEKTGRLEEAEAFYRRAVAIATESLPPGDPMVAASRENLEAFCRARGLPIDVPAIAVAPVPGPDAAPASDEPGPDTTRAAAKVPGVPAAPERSATPLPVPLSAPAAPTAADPLPQASQKGTPPIAWAIGAAAVLVVALLVWRPWSPSDPHPHRPCPRRRRPRRVSSLRRPRRQHVLLPRSSRHHQPSRRKTTSGRPRHPATHAADTVSCSHAGGGAVVPELLDERRQLALRSSRRRGGAGPAGSLHAREIGCRWHRRPPLVSRNRTPTVRDPQDARQRDAGISHLQPADRGRRTRVASGGEKRERRTALRAALRRTLSADRAAHKSVVDI